LKIPFWKDCFELQNLFELWKYLILRKYWAGTFGKNSTRFQTV